MFAPKKPGFAHPWLLPYCSLRMALSLHTFKYHYGKPSAAQLTNRKPPRFTPIVVRRPLYLFPSVLTIFVFSFIVSCWLSLSSNHWIHKIFILCKRHGYLNKIVNKPIWFVVVNGIKTIHIIQSIEGNWLVLHIYNCKYKFKILPLIILKSYFEEDSPVLQSWNLFETDLVFFQESRLDQYRNKGKDLLAKVYTYKDERKIVPRN